MRRFAVLITIALMLIIARAPAEDSEVAPQPKPKCIGYTVLDHDRVITCKGDTVEYNWKPRL